MYGFSYIKWHFDTSKDLKDDCILGQDYLMDRNTSPLTLYRIMNLAKQKICLPSKMDNLNEQVKNVRDALKMTEMALKKMKQI